MAVHNSNILGKSYRKEEIQHIKELFTILQVNMHVSKNPKMYNMMNISVRSKINYNFRNVQDKPKTPTEKKESVMLKESKAR